MFPAVATDILQKQLALHSKNNLIYNISVMQFIGVFIKKLSNRSLVY